MGADPVDILLSAIEAGDVGNAHVFTGDAVLDATVPNWRFTIRGGDAVRAQLAGWYADPGRFDELRRTPIPGGELVEFALGWEEHGVPHACHQVHILEVRGGLIARDVVFCGGRWPASLLAEMAEAERARDGG
jgi:hypothetical protein